MKAEAGRADASEAVSAEPELKSSSVRAAAAAVAGDGSTRSIQESEVSCRATRRLRPCNTAHPATPPAEHPGAPTRLATN